MSAHIIVAEYGRVVWRDAAVREKLTIGFAICMTVLFLPYFITLMITGLTGGASVNASIESLQTGRTVSVEYSGEYEVLDVERYLLGVLPAITDSDCELEVWKALAVIERTNIYRQMGGSVTIDEADLVEEYLTEEEIRRLWGERRYRKELRKIEKAIVATAGQTMTYDGEYITAYYHKVSPGTTVSAEELLGQAIPYLQAVDSGHDVESKDYMTLIVAEEEGLPICELAVTQATEHGYVREVSINGELMTADEFCRRYHVPSYNFYIEELSDDPKSYRIVALGMGHGMGMSIYGAGVMSRDGREYQDILKYYYPGVQIQ